MPKAISRLVGEISGKRNPRRGHSGGQTHRAAGEMGEWGVRPRAWGLLPPGRDITAPLPQATGSLLFL